MSKKPLFAIIDGHAIIHRAYHAIPPLTTKDGQIVNAVYGFTSMLLKVITDIKPTHLAVSFDVSGGTFRDEVYEDYKATRSKSDQDLYDQIPLIYDVVEAFGVPIYSKEGFEADDVIGTVVKKLNKEQKGLESVIVTGDMDILQLVDDQTTVYSLRKGLSDIVRYDAPAVKARYGFGPEMVIDYKALRGDASDNIPGVKGVGEKTAVKLLTEIGDLDKIYEGAEKEDERIKPRYQKLLMEYKDDAYMSQDLATIRRDVKGLKVDFDECEWGGFDYDAIRDTFQRFEFLSLLKRVPGYVEHKAEAPPEKPVLVNKNVIAAKIDSLLTGVVVVLPVVTEQHLTSLILLHDGKQYTVTDAKEHTEELLTSLFSTKNFTLVGHDLKSLLRLTKDCHTDVNATLFDTMVASYLLSTGERSHDLDAVMQREFAGGGSAQATLFGTESPVGEILQNLHDLFKRYTEGLKKEKMTKLFEEMEMPLLPVLASMECEGVELDTAFLAKMSKDVHKQIDELVTTIHKLADQEFNVASSVQLRKVLYEDLKLPTEMIKKGKTGYSTAASELEKLRGEHEIIGHIEKFREVTKLQNTYIDVLPTLVNSDTGRLHTTFHQTVAATGRLSSADPNLQNIPTRTALGRTIRNAFVAKKGHKLVAADYSQIELRVAAHLSNDKELIRIFNAGEDVHTSTAASIHNIPIEDVTKDIRSTAKEVNFGVLYGMGSFGLASRTSLTIAEASEFIEAYFDAFSGVKEYIEKTKKTAKKNGYVKTLFDRRRYVPELSSANAQLRHAGERMAINMPMQGTVADMMKIAMIEVQKKLKKFEGTNMLLQVHDEIILEVPDDQVESVGKMVEKEMKAVIDLVVPVEVSVRSGDSWGEL